MFQTNLPVDQSAVVVSFNPKLHALVKRVNHTSKCNLFHGFYRKAIATQITGPSQTDLPIDQSAVIMESFKTQNYTTIVSSIIAQHIVIKLALKLN